jgi:hypothetical protein
MLEGSDDGRGWYVIDRRKNDESFQDGVATAIFGAQRGVFCTHVRLVQTARNHLGSHVLSLKAVEFFGHSRNTDT